MKTHARLTLFVLLGCLAAGPALAQDTRPTATAPATGAVPAQLRVLSPEQEKQAEELFEAGRKLFFQGDYAAAAAKMSQAIAANPAKSSYKLLLAKAQRYAGKDKEAAATLETILKENPEHVDAAVELAELLAPEQQPDRVIAVLEPLLKFKHDYPLYHLLARAYYQKEQLDKAREYLEEAVRLNPRSVSDWEHLANIYLAQKRFAKAADAYEQAGSLGANSAAYHFKLASVYFNLRNYLGAVSVAEVLGGKPGEIKNDLYLIELVQAPGDPLPASRAAVPSAAGAARAAVIHPPLPPAPAKKDVFYVARAKSAIYQVAKAQALGIEVAQIKFLEANIWLNARRYAKADALYKALEGKLEKADQGLFWFYWSQAALGLDDLDQYLARLQKAIEAEPEVYKPTLADAYLTVANRYQARGQNQKFVDFLVKAVATNPLSASLHLTLGDAHWQAADKAKAIEQYKLVLELEPDHAQRVRLLNRIRGQEDVTGAAAAAPNPGGAAPRH